MKKHSSLSLLPLLNELKERIEALEAKTEHITPSKVLNDTAGNSLDMTEIQDYIEKMHH